MHGHSGVEGGVLDLLTIGAVLAAAVLYLGGVMTARRRGRDWPQTRTACWLAALLITAVTLAGPFAAAAHDDFVTHMVGHLLAGMVAPLFLVAAAPATLALRALHPRQARRLSRLLASRPARFVIHPVTAAAINVGSLWVLYTTPLFGVVQSSPFLHLLVTVHFVIAGYLFVSSMIGIDPNPHRASYPLRTVVLIAALAGHSILAKYLYAHPPIGVDATEATTGSVVMYYGGDVADAAIIAILCLQWYRAAGKRQSRVARASAVTAAASSRPLQPRDDVARSGV